MSILETESGLTDRYQTTVPEPVRRALGLAKRDRLRYEIQADGVVILTKADSVVEDTVMNAFLTFLAHDIESRPDAVTGLDPLLVDRIVSLVAGIEIDLDASLSDEDE
ncbi:MAG: type II toxin-antitoxin system PrlF family antitoxin [Actinomycetota bacterium]|nr:type II toxin-antitoxin system PrlF family antitoxin [Actinomycetota bacterium]